MSKLYGIKTTTQFFVKLGCCHHTLFHRCLRLQLQKFAKSKAHCSAAVPPAWSLHGQEKGHRRATRAHSIRPARSATALPPTHGRPSALCPRDARGEKASDPHFSDACGHSRKVTKQLLLESGNHCHKSA